LPRFEFVYHNSFKEYLPSTIEEAMDEYEYQQVAAANNSDGGGNGNGGGSAAPAYQPPETLPRPLKFKDAFWSSTLPSDIGHDIRRLQNGVDNAISQITDPGTISLQDIPVGADDENDHGLINQTNIDNGGKKPRMGRSQRLEQQFV
jgi:hypothetical protein